MSRIGNQPIEMPSGVSISIDHPKVTVKGPKGELSNSFHVDMGIVESEGIISISRASDEAAQKAFHGLTRSLLNNMTLSVMLSHTVTIDPPDGVTLEVSDDNRIKISGIDKQAVGQIAAEIRRVRPPNAYTGKGIRYAYEQVKLKPGKSASK
jgi:large subunit ribosomal protein L6